MLSFHGTSCPWLNGIAIVSDVKLVAFKSEGHSGLSADSAVSGWKVTDMGRAKARASRRQGRELRSVKFGVVNY